MKTKKLTILSSMLLFFSLCFGATLSVYAYSCKAVIYNQSNQPWVFSSQTRAGNVHFAGCPVNGPCAIAAGKTQPITYTQSWGNSSGTMKVTDYKNRSNIFHFNSGGKKCPLLAYKNVSDAVQANQPTIGNFTIIADSWEESVKPLK